MEAKYEKYFNTLKDSQIKENATKLSNSVIRYESTINRLNSQINSSKWQELGLQNIKNNLIPQILNTTRNIKTNVDDSLIKICNSLINELLPMLTELNSKENEYNNLETDNPKRTTLYSEINSLKQKIDSKISELEGTEIVQGQSVETIVNGQTISMTESEIEAARTKFIGNIETDNYTVDSSAGHSAQTLRMFYNGVELKDGSTITIKKGETAKITVKLPTTAGKITAMTRNTADGQGYDKNEDGTRTRTNYAWDRWLSAHSEPHCDNRSNTKNRTPIVTNNYEWVITGDQSTNGKAVNLSQTACFTTENFKNGIKSFADLKVIVVD